MTSTHLDLSQSLQICWFTECWEKSYSSSRWLCVGYKNDPGRKADIKEVSLF